MTEELPNHDVLAAHGYVIAYDRKRIQHMTCAELLHHAFPGLFVHADEGVWCHVPGSTLILAVRHATDAKSARFNVKPAREVAIQREIVAAIKCEFSENSVRALAAAVGKEDAAKAIAERAAWRIEITRTGKPPKEIPRP